MIFNKLIDLIVGLLQAAFNALPQGHLTLPNATPFANALGTLDSLVPILGVLHVALVMLAAVVAFFVLRLVLVIVNIIWP